AWTAFSSSSLTTDAGRSITSPAAILVTTLGGSWRMRGMGVVSRPRVRVGTSVGRAGSALPLPEGVEVRLQPRHLRLRRGEQLGPGRRVPEHQPGAGPLQGDPELGTGQPAVGRLEELQLPAA